MTILVTGASGHLGRLVVEALLARDVAPAEILAGARDTAKIADLAERGVQAVRLDYDDAATIRDAVTGVDRVLLVSGSEVGKRIAQHAAVIEIAKAAGVGHLVYTSLAAADTSPLPLAPEHVATEELLGGSGLTTTILRNNWYVENSVQSVEQVRATGSLSGSSGEGRTRPATRADYAEAAAVVLTTDGHEGAVYELAGDQALTLDDTAAAIGRVLGTDVAVQHLSEDEHRASLESAGLDAGTAAFVVALDAGTRDGALDVASDDLARLIGRPTTPFEDGLRAAVA